ncbi:MAG: GNAT family N-acetyltransferase [Actinomycetota bacterium]
MADTSIRLGTFDDLAAVVAVENAADERFSDVDLDLTALDGGSDPSPHLVTAATDGRLAVAVDDDRIIGFAWWSSLGEGAHLEQVSVLTEAAGRQLGGRLIEWVAGEARDAGHALLTLTTFADIPWNAPLYRRYGFDDHPDSEWRPELAERVAQEASAGLDVLPRVAMSRVL